MNGPGAKRFGVGHAQRASWRCTSAAYRLANLAGVANVRDAGKRWDVVFDTVGVSSFAESDSVLAKRGVFIPAVISIRSLFEGVWTPLTGGKRLVGGVSMDKREPLRYVAELLADDALRVVIDTTSPMDRILRAMGLQVERGGGVWSFEYLETPVLIITDSKANRMRVMSPVIRAEEVTADQWAAILVANFHTALDARYAVSSGTVYSLFLHPLGSLTDAELRSAIGQVVVLSTTFGSTYTSSGIAFGGGTPPNSEPATKPTPSL